MIKLTNRWFVFGIVALLFMGVWLHSMVAAELGDLNNDNYVNSIDFAQFQRCLLGSISLPLPRIGDFNSDGEVNSLDFALFKRYLLGLITLPTPTATATTFPTPTAETSLVGYATLNGGTTGGQGGPAVTVSTGTELQSAINAGGDPGLFM